MGEFLKIILLFVSLISGAIAIFFSFQLMKKFRLAFVNSYFYYLVFLYIFGSYSLAGSGIMEYLLTRMEVERQVIRSVTLITLLVGVPFFALAQYMLLRSIIEFFSRKIPSWTTIGYFALVLSAFIVYGVLVVRLTRFSLGEYEFLVSIQRLTFLIFLALMYGLSGILAFTLSSRQVQKPQKRFIRIFGAGYLTFMGLACISFSLISWRELFDYIFLFLFLSWHLIPILFMGLYLARYHGETSRVVRDFEQQLIRFVRKYEISKREKEVIRLICTGLSNQQISDSLYISLQTVKDHIHHIYTKTGVKNRVQLTNLIRSDS